MKIDCINKNNTMWLRKRMKIQDRNIKGQCFGDSLIFCFTKVFTGYTSNSKFPLHLNIHYVIYAFPDFARLPD